MRKNVLKAFGGILLAGVLAAPVLCLCRTTATPAPQEHERHPVIRGVESRKSRARSTIFRLTPTAISADTREGRRTSRSGAEGTSYRDGLRQALSARTQEAHTKRSGDILRTTPFSGIHYGRLNCEGLSTSSLYGLELFRALPLPDGRCDSRSRSCDWQRLARAAA